MIASLRGTVVHAASDAVVLEVGGVGYAVSVTSEVARGARLGDDLLLHTHMIVREDALTLVGFRSREELAVFAILLAVSGVGPKSALGVLAALSIDQIAQAVADEADAPFRKVSGIGPKTAKLIVVQLADEVGGHRRTAAETAERVVSGSPDESSVAGLLRRALVQLGPARTDQSRG